MIINAYLDKIEITHFFSVIYYKFSFILYAIRRVKNVKLMIIPNYLLLDFSEVLDENNPWFCPSCKKNQCATKSLSIWRFPQYLIVYLKRYFSFCNLIFNYMSCWNNPVFNCCWTYILLHVHNIWWPKLWCISRSNLFTQKSFFKGLHNQTLNL